MIKKWYKRLMTIGFSIVLLTGCIPEKRVSQTSAEAAKQELTISSYFPSPYLNEAAKAFQKENPQIKVTIHTFQTDGGTIKSAGGEMTKGDDDPNHSLENYVTYLNTAFMSGQADDMILLTWLPVERYAQSGYLLDLSDYIQSDQTITEETYYTNILRANTYKNMIYSIPMSFGVNVLGCNEEAVQRSGLSRELFEIEYWDFDKMEQLYSGVSGTDSKQITLQTNSGTSIFLELFQLESYRFIDIENKNVSIDSKEFIELLERCKSFEAQGMLNKEENNESYSLFTNKMGESNRVYQSHYLEKPEGISFVRPLTNTKGEIAISTGLQMSITKDAKNANLCWEFIRFMLSQEMQDSPELSGSCLVNKEANKMHQQRLVKQAVKSLKQEKLKYALSEDELLELLLKDLDKWSQAKMVKYPPSAIIDVVAEEVSLYFNEGKSAEEVAKKLQNKVYVMVNE